MSNELSSQLKRAWSSDGQKAYPVDQLCLDNGIEGPLSLVTFERPTKNHRVRISNHCIPYRRMATLRDLQIAFQGFQTRGHHWSEVQRRGGRSARGLHQKKGGHSVSASLDSEPYQLELLMLQPALWKTCDVVLRPHRQKQFRAQAAESRTALARLSRRHRRLKCT